MQVLSLVASAAVAVSVASAFQVLQPPKSSYERRGLYHATIQGRVVSPLGDPLGGVHIQLDAGRPRSLPLADVVTGSDGRFILSDVNSIYPPYLTWHPPEEWLEGSISVTGENASVIDVGEILLRPASIVRVAIEVAGGEPLQPGDLEPEVVLVGEAEGLRIVGETVGAEQILHDISFEKGNWEVRLYSKGRSEVYTAPYYLQPSQRHQKFTLRLLRDTVKQTSPYRSEGRMEVSMSTAPATTRREFRVRGRVVGPDESPIEGAFVNTFKRPIRSSMIQWTRTGSNGGFDLSYTSTNCTKPRVSFGDSDYWNLYLSKPSLRDLSCEDWLKTPQTLRMPKPSRLMIRVAGLDPAKARAAWWHDSFGWQRLASLTPWVPGLGLWQAKIRTDADGYLPLTQKLELPYFDPEKEEPPAELPLTFQFDSRVQRTLSVRSAGKPLPGATVDIEAVVSLESDERRFLKTYKVAADGRLQLLGGGDEVIEAFVYAEGFEPRRAIWNPGNPLVIDMRSRSSNIEFPASSSAIVARIREAGSPRAVRTVNLSAKQRTRAPVAPGVYDITCYNARGTVAGYQRLKAVGATAMVDCSIDQRPRLTVRLPGDGWRLSFAESTPSGSGRQRAARISVPGFPPFSEVGVTTLSESKTEPIFALSYTGKWHIEARERDRTVILWRDIDLQPGASLMVVIPTETGTLRGSMRTYGGGLERSDHGVAGPRLQLIADDPGTWSVTDYVPRRDSREGEAKHQFTLSGIPTGSYHLFQHLIGKPETYTYARTTTAYTAPIAAWGGIPVQIAVAPVTVVKDFSDYPLSDLQVRVVTADGRPVEHATVRIRDRMSEFWRQVEEDPAQLEEAAHPIPYPAAARIVRGRATLPRIREGRLHLSIELDTGATFGFTVAVSPQRELSLTLPPEK